MALPYRAKNPPERFPWLTIALIVTNALVFAITSDAFLFIREEAVQRFALSHATFSPVRVLTSMFLHGSLLHLAGNMLFLWVFGAALEGRLGPPRFLALYLLSGLAGDLLHEAILGVTDRERFSLGASGAIMGVAGGYLRVFPYSTICVAYRRWGWGIGVSEWQARWVVLLYVALDVIQAFLFRGQDGVGHLAHLGGFGAGLLFVILLRARRDSERASQAQAVHADLKDPSCLSLSELAALAESRPQDAELLTTYCHSALTNRSGARVRECVATLEKHASLLLAKGDPNRLAWILLALPLDSGLRPVLYLRLASRLESLAGNDHAFQLYRRVLEMAPGSADAEMALLRMARIMRDVYQDPVKTESIYREILRDYPFGAAAVDARRALDPAWKA